MVLLRFDMMRDFLGASQSMFGSRMKLLHQGLVEGKSRKQDLCASAEHEEDGRQREECESGLLLWVAGYDHIAFGASAYRTCSTKHFNSTDSNGNGCLARHDGLDSGRSKQGSYCDNCGLEIGPRCCLSNSICENKGEEQPSGCLHVCADCEGEGEQTQP